MQSKERPQGLSFFGSIAIGALVMDVKNTLGKNQIFIYFCNKNMNLMKTIEILNPML